MYLKEFLTPKHLLLLLLGLFLAMPANSVRGNSPAEMQYLKDRIGGFRAVNAATAIQGKDVRAFVRRYLSPEGARFAVYLLATNSESEAYATLRKIGAKPVTNEVGFPAYLSGNGVSLAKGRIHAEIKAEEGSPDVSALVTLARAVAEVLPRGEEDVPVLVKHLPDWERAQHSAQYFRTHETLRSAIPTPILDAVSFDGAEAVSAQYERAQLVIIEFTTPQLATENDKRIVSRLEELRSAGQPLPTAYRRVGNYAVFVLNGNSEEAAKHLIDQVKYEQVTQWLGDNPYPLLEAQRRYTETTLGVLVSVVKASGLALITCFTAGGLFGALLFLRRRAQQQSVKAYSDAGGMLRLNLDEMTPQVNPARLLGK